MGGGGAIGRAFKITLRSGVVSFAFFCFGWTAGVCGVVTTEFFGFANMSAGDASSDFRLFFFFLVSAVVGCGCCTSGARTFTFFTTGATTTGIVLAGATDAAICSGDGILLSSLSELMTEEVSRGVAACLI